MPSRTGVGASGTWNIDISGSASISTADVNAAIAGSTAGQVGTYAFLKLTNTSDNGTVVDYTVAGSALSWVGVTANGSLAVVSGGSITGYTTISGTWRAMGWGRLPLGQTGNSATLYLRIS